MPFNQTNKKKVTDFYTPKKVQILQATQIKVGPGRPEDVKEANFLEMEKDLRHLGVYNKAADVTEAAVLLGTILGRIVEVQAPPNDNGAARKLAALNRDSSTVKQTINNVDVRLDIDQLKHQHSTQPIGTRHKGGGNRFNATATIAWHEAYTMAYMAAWASGLALAQGQDRFHGQGNAVDGIHYEGFCLMADGRKYVLFHCYPANDSALRGPNG